MSSSYGVNRLEDIPDRLSDIPDSMKEELLKHASELLEKHNEAVRRNMCFEIGSHINYPMATVLKFGDGIVTAGHSSNQVHQCAIDLNNGSHAIVDCGGGKHVLVSPKLAKVIAQTGSSGLSLDELREIRDNLNKVNA